MSSAVGHLLVDARPVDHPTARQRGIGRYVTGLLHGLLRHGAPFTALYGGDLEAEVLADAIPGLPLERWSPDVVRRHARPDTWFVATQLMLHPVPLDPIPRVITRARLPVAAVMYDVIPLRHPEMYLVDPPALRLAQVRAPLARTCDALLAISEFSADTAAAELGYPRDRIAMIGAGVEPRFRPASVDELPRPDRVLPPDVDRFVVAVTGGDERKNTEGLLRAWAEVPAAVRTRYRLVVATAHSPEVLRRWTTWADDAGVLDEVVFTGSVTDDEMVALLQRAALSVMPSIDEGFGLPVIEAAACGCPAISSDRSSLPEVLDEPAACFDPSDTRSMADAITRALTDDDHRERLLAAGRRAVGRWTWERVGADTVSALSAIGPRWATRVRRPPRRVGLVGPFEGSTSGIGTYDARLAAAWPTAVPDTVLECFVDASGDPTPTNSGRRPAPAHDGGGADAAVRWPARALPRSVSPWDLDHLVVVLGSSHHHVAAADLATRVPAHVWLHEASLVGVHVGLAHASGSEGWARAHVAERVAADRSRSTDTPLGADVELLDADALAEAGVTMLGEVLDRARSVVVSSSAAADRVRAVRPDAPPILVLPLAHPPVSEPRSVPTAAELVSVGWLAVNKEPELSVRVLAELVGRGVDARLTFVGPSVGDVVERIEGVAARLGVGGRIGFTGWLGSDAYRARLRTARVALQLRRDERGEMSGAVVDLLAAGVPTVTTMSSSGPSSPGLAVVAAGGAEPTERAAALADAAEPLLVDDAAWRTAADDARARAAAWSHADVARRLSSWLDEVASHPPGTVVHAGPGTGTGVSSGATDSLR